jgi:phosphoserine phosphatase RsbU/P
MGYLKKYGFIVVLVTLGSFLVIIQFRQISDFIVLHHTVIFSVAVVTLLVAVIAQFKQNEILRENERLYCELQLKQARIDSDLTMAREIQQGILNEKIPEVAGYRLTAFCAPAQKIGGDFYGFKKIDSSLHFYLGDVSGHGISSALLMSLTNGLIHEIMKAESSPGAILSNLNLTLCRCLNNNINYITMVYGKINLKTNVLTYTSAGHHPMLLFRGPGEPLALTTNKPMLGVFTKNNYSEKSCRLKSGDKLVLYTDAVLESKNIAGEPLGERFLISAVSRHLELKGTALKNAVYDAIYKAAPEIHDDLSLLIVEKT